MGVKEFKKMKELLTEQLQDKLKELISGPEVTVTISDDLERIVVSLLTTKTNKEAATIASTENILVYNVKEPNNIIFQGYGKNILYKNGIVSGFSADYGQIDLTTLYMLQQFVYSFCVEKELIELKENTDNGVGEEESEE